VSKTEGPRKKWPIPMQRWRGTYRQRGRHIKKAYRKLAKELHPDRTRIIPGEERFSTVTNAYDLLTDKDSAPLRSRRDRRRQASRRAVRLWRRWRPRRLSPGARRFRSRGSRLSDIFEGMFSGGGSQRRFRRLGGFGRNPAKGAMSLSLNIPFTDAAILSPQRITLATARRST